MEGGVDGNHWEALRDLLPAYRCITKVIVGDGRSTSFWWDTWTEDAPLAQRFPCLFSHCTNHNVSVFKVCSDGLDSVLVARLSLQAIHEKAELSCLINSTHLQQHPDERSSFFATNGHRLDTSQLYRTSTQSGHRSQSYSFVWKNYAPPGSNSLAGYCYKKEFTAGPTLPRKTSWMMPCANCADNLRRTVNTSSFAAQLPARSGLILAGT